jgi:DNA-binding protein
VTGDSKFEHLEVIVKCRSSSVITAVDVVEGVKTATVSERICLFK